ncbi:MAG: hypothetical protein IPG07_22145 [Crocinitomicaceae bacterium]|nr:hypothetical protein [Crocinitomicaceae bacterium]
MPAVNGTNLRAASADSAIAFSAKRRSQVPGTITITGLNLETIIAFTINDGTGCPYTASRTFLCAPAINAGADQTICIGAAVVPSQEPVLVSVVLLLE